MRRPPRSVTSFTLPNHYLDRYSTTSTVTPATSRCAVVAQLRRRSRALSLRVPIHWAIFLKSSSASFAEHMSRRPARCSPLRRCHPVTIALTGQRVWRHPSADGSMHSPAPRIISPQFGQELTYCADHCLQWSPCCKHRGRRGRSARLYDFREGTPLRAPRDYCLLHRSHLVEIH